MKTSTTSAFLLLCPVIACSGQVTPGGDGDGADAGLSGNGDAEPPVVITAYYYVDPGGSDENPCTEAAPCRSLQRGYEVASDDQGIAVRAGHYERQDLAEGTRRVTFLGEPGAVIYQLHSRASNVTFDGLEVDAGSTRRPAAQPSRATAMTRPSRTARSAT